jgi:hypothetical protein
MAMTKTEHSLELMRISRILLLLLSICLLDVPVAFGQQATEMRLVNAYNQYKSQYLQEKLYVHTDKDSYLSGEICWFRLYYMDAFTNRPAVLSKIAYVEILDKNNRPVLQEKISLKPAESHGSLMIPSSISSGTYIFRAYTSWMKNFGPGYYFEKAIRIINPHKLEPDSSIAKIKRYDLQFFPEGGNLVQQIESKVGFRITDAYGHGLECEGLLLGSNADTVLKFQTLHKGLGHFIFTPVAGQSYKALIRFPQGETVLKELPSAYPSGYVLNLTKNGEGMITATVHVTRDLAGQKIFLAINGQKTLLPVRSGTLTADSLSFSIESRELEDGISKFTLFTETAQPVCERLFFKYPVKILRISSDTDPQYGIRKKISVNLAVTNQQENSVSADFSLAVYRIDSLQPVDENSILNYLYLTSELGPVESPSYYFNEDGKDREADIENLMLTHGWRRFDWKNIIQQKSIHIEYPPEYFGHIIHGKVVDSRNGPVPLTSAFLSVPSKRTQFRVTTSDSSGKVKFELIDFYGSSEIIVQTNPTKDSTAHLEIDNPFSQKYSGFNPPDFSIPAKGSPSLLDHSIHAQVQRVYEGAKMDHTLLQYVDTNTFYIIPDEKYLLDDYTRFLTMEEVFREYVHSTSVVRNRDNFHIYLYDLTARLFFEDAPLILIDGVPFFNFNEIISQNPMKIKQIDLINRQYAMGYKTYSGVLNMTTYHGDLDGIELDPHVIVLDYPGIPEERQFFSPQYETELQINSRMPDYRNTMYWAPGVKSGSDGKAQVSFYSSDLPGKYALVIQGLSNKGEVGHQIRFFDVKKQ